MTKTIIFAALTFLLGTAVAQANPGDTAKNKQATASKTSSTDKSVQPTPADVFREGIYELQQFMGSNKVNDSGAVAAFIHQRIKPKFDTQKMAKLAAGQYYEQMSEKQRQIFTKKLEMMFFKGFIQHLVSRSSEQPKIQFLKKRRNKDEKLVDVLARALYPDGDAKRLVFRFADSDKGWRVYDVSADGSSAILYFRRYFTMMARNMEPEAMLQ